MQRIARYIIVTLLLAVALLPTRTNARAEQAAPVRIMPLGDSITSSMNGFASYRYWLWHHLLEQPTPVDFIGSQTGVWDGTPKYNDFDQDHEGRSSWTSQMLWELIRDRIWTNENTPDVVLVHIGTAALCLGESTDTITANDGLIIGKLQAVNPGVDILIAKIIPSDPNADPYSADCQANLNPANIRVLNDKVELMAAAKNTPTSRVIVVDMYTGYDPVLNNINDRVHPNESGEKIIAARWAGPLTELLNGLNQHVFLPVASR